MTGLRTSYEFTLPRGYVDNAGELHRVGTMRLATARDELEPLRDPRIDGPDDPRLTVLVLTRVVTHLGSLDQVTSFEIEGLFAVDLAFLQDFYGVINFGDQAEYDALISAQQSSALLGVTQTGGAAPAATGDAETGDSPESDEETSRPSIHRAVEELPRRAQ